MRIDTTENGTGASAAPVERVKQGVEKAKETAREVAETTAAAASDVAATAAGDAKVVASTAKAQAAQVTQEVAEQGRRLVSEAQRVARLQAEQQAQRAAQAVQRVAEQLAALVDGRPDEAGPLKEYVQQAAGKVQTFAQSMETRGYDGLVGELKSLARRRPGAFLAGAAFAGFAAARLARAATAPQQDDPSLQTPDDYTYTGGTSSGLGTGLGTAPPGTSAVTDALLGGYVDDSSAISDPIGDATDALDAPIPPIAGDAAPGTTGIGGER